MPAIGKFLCHRRSSSHLRLAIILSTCSGPALADPGTLDPGFDPGTGFNNIVTHISLRPDGKIFAGGSFTSFNGTNCANVALVTTNGALETSFDPGTGPSSPPECVAADVDGKALISGTFTSVNGVSRFNFARLNTDGNVDLGFNNSGGTANPVHIVVPLTNGDILLGGFFDHVGSASAGCVARVDTNGVADPGFSCVPGANDFVYCVAPGTNGAVLLGGVFTKVNGTNRGGIARLKSNGSLDTAFNPAGGANAIVLAIASQADGKVLVGGDFIAINGTNRNRIARLNADGSLDSGFDPGTGANAVVWCLGLQPDGKVLMGGDFTNVNGIVRNHIARLNPDGSLDSLFDPGTGPNGRVQDLALQPDGKVLIGGGFVTVNGVSRRRIARLGVPYVPASITAQPRGSASYVGSNITFSVVAAGQLPLVYQWRFNGTNIPGATASAYTRTNIQVSDTGNFTVVVSNIANMVTSAVAMLVVTPPPGPNVIAQWNFNSSIPDDNSGTGTNTPSFGNGVASLVGGVVSTNTVGDSSDPAGTNDNSAWFISNFPAQGTGNKTAGVQFSVSTAGRQGVSVSWKQFVGGVASKYFRLQYTSNGVDFVDFPTPTVMVACCHSPFEPETNDLSSVLSLNDNLNFAFRIVSEFESTAIGTTNAQYITASPVITNYLGFAPTFFDMVTVYGSPLPPSLSSSAYTTNHQFRFTLAGVPGANYVIEATTNLAPPAWIAIYTNAAPFLFTDTNAPNFPTRFYRARTWQSFPDMRRSANTRFQPTPL